MNCRLAFNSKILAEKLRILSQVTRDGSDVASRCVLIHRNATGSSTCSLHVSAPDHQVEVRVPFELIEGEWVRNFVVDLKTLHSLVKASGDSFYLTDMGRNLWTHVLGGEVEVETYVLEAELRKLGFLYTTKEGVEVQRVQDFLDFMALVSESSGFAAKSDEKKVCVVGGVGVCSFLTAAVLFRDVPVPSLQVNSSVFPFIKGMIGESTFKVHERERDYLFTTSDSLFTVPRVNGSGSDRHISFVESEDRLGRIPVNVKELSEIMSLVWDVVGIQGRCRFVSEEGVLRFMVTTGVGRVMRFRLAPCQEELDWGCHVPSLQRLSRLIGHSTEGILSVSPEGYTIFDSSSFSVVLGFLGLS